MSATSFLGLAGLQHCLGIVGKCEEAGSYRHDVISIMGLAVSSLTCYQFWGSGCWSGTFSLVGVELLVTVQSDGIFSWLNVWKTREFLPLSGCHMVRQQYVVLGEELKKCLWSQRASEGKQFVQRCLGTEKTSKTEKEKDRSYQGQTFQCDQRLMIGLPKIFEPTRWVTVSGCLTFVSL